MPALQIRQARAADATAACERCGARSLNYAKPITAKIRNSWRAGSPTRRPKMLRPRSPIAANVVYVAIRGEAIAGVASMTKAGIITLNYVSPDARFHGVSRALLAALERKAAELGLTHCRLESTKTARRFYEAAGYREQSGTAGGCGANAQENCRPMVKKLARAVTTR